MSKDSDKTYLLVGDILSINTTRLLHPLIYKKLYKVIRLTIVSNIFHEVLRFQLQKPVLKMN